MAKNKQMLILRNKIFTHQKYMQKNKIDKKMHNIFIFEFFLQEAKYFM
jgi:hypothetical protein